MADFFARTKELEKLVGDGSLVGTFVVNGGGRTIPLEVGYWKEFMGNQGFKKIRNYNDGGPHAVQKSLDETWAGSLEDIAKGTLVQGPQEGMRRHVGRMREEFQKKAPIRTGSYRDSYAEVVTDNGMPIHEIFGAHYGEEPSG